jgi:hypothetical protein
MIRLVLIISSGYYLLRIRFCCRALSPPYVQVRVAASPEFEKEERRAARFRCA